MIIFITPPEPSASYFADGFVITSILSISSADMDFNASAKLPDSSPEGRPLIKNLIFLLPRIETLPSISTSTMGTFDNISLKEEPLLVMS